MGPHPSTFRTVMITFLVMIFILHIPDASCLRNVKIHVPMSVIPGQTVTMICNYDLEGDPLYTVKWYKSRQEFFRYVPKELPHTRVFPYPGINVDVSQSGSNQVVLRDVQMDIAGKYRCEISADAPNFHTEVVSSYMHVVQMNPEEEPTIQMEKPRYSIGDTLRGNCTTAPSSAAANITWLVNDKRMNASYFRVENLTKAQSTDPTMYLTVAGIELEITSFQVGKLKIQCKAEVFQFESIKKIVLDEERPQLASVLGTRASSAGLPPQLSSQPKTLVLWSLVQVLLICWATR
uniref:Ig-like domain-containing protein n=1 Tax=Cacopsylla melanoneura TaxID=428564 RepID=A0A8D8WUI6_9HEMI